MARLAFFGTVKDYRSIFDFLFSTTDCCLYEFASEYGQPLRKFTSTDEVAECFVPSPVRAVNAVPLWLWSPTAFGKPRIERTSLKPEYCDGHTFRFTYRGPGSAAFHFGAISQCEVCYSEYSHFDENSPIGGHKGDGVKWPVFKKLTNKIQYHIRGRLAIVKLPGHSVLPDAMEEAKKGALLVRHQLLRWGFDGTKLVQHTETGAAG